MAMNGYMDDELNVMCEDLFENIEDFFDFSNDEALEMVNSGANIAPSPPPPASAAAALPLPLSSSDNSSEGCQITAAASDDGKICDEINISEDWISKFLDDDTNFGMDFPVTSAVTTPVFINNKDEASLFRSLSPVSVLEPSNLSNKGGSSLSSSSSSSSSTTSNINEAETVSLVAPVGPIRMLIPARARSKRPRRAAPTNATLPILPPVSDGPPAIPTILPETTESFGESLFSVVPPMKKKKKKNLTIGANLSAEDASGARRCMHCGIQKTPQWRAGPMGPKTLCNACGVRYKSGRLFPEYRPAASPTFVPSIHSNSHKKVVEMRIKATQHKPVNGPVYPAVKNCDLLEYIRWKD